MHRDLAITEVDVLNPQTDAFHQAQPSTVEQFSHQSILAIDACKHGLRFCGRENDGNFGRACNALDVIDEVELSLQHLLVKEQQGTKSLILSRCGDAFFYREISQKFGDFFLAHFLWMAFAMEQNESAYPINVRLLGPNGVMFDPQLPAYAIE